MNKNYAIETKETLFVKWTNHLGKYVYHSVDFVSVIFETEGG